MKTWADMTASLRAPAHALLDAFEAKYGANYCECSEPLTDAAVGATGDTSDWCWRCKRAIPTDPDDMEAPDDE